MVPWTFCYIIDQTFQISMKATTIKMNSPKAHAGIAIQALVFIHILLSAIFWQASPAHGEESAPIIPLDIGQGSFHVGDSKESPLLLPPSPWENWESVSEFDFNRLNDEKSLWLRFRLPGSSASDTSVLLTAFVTGFRAYLDDELIYAYGKESENANPDFAYHMSHLITLGPLDPGHHLSIRVAYESRAGLGELHSLILGSTADLTDIMIAERDDLYRRSIVDVCLGFLLVVMGMASLMIFIVRWRQRTMPFLSFGLFAVFSGATYLSDHNATFFLNFSPETHFYFKSLSFLLVPAGLFAFADNMFKTRYRAVIRAFWIVHLLFAISSFYLIRLGMDYTFVFLAVLVINCSICMAIILKSGEAADKLIKTSFLVFFALFIVLILLHVLELMNLIPSSFDVFGWGLIVFVVALGFFLLRHYTTTFYAMQTVSLELERNKSELLEVQKENLISQLEALKNQIDPHFLFNNFSTLAAIIDEDKSMAVTFVQELSKVYRYVLQTRVQTLVTLEEEIGFLESYKFLMSKRFGENMILNITIPDRCRQMMVMPFALQLLVENAVKHNVVSQKKPLVIDVTASEDRVTVKNKLQKKNQPVRSTGIGLANIQNRYRLVTDKAVILTETETEFNISIPLIERNGE